MRIFVGNLAFTTTEEELRQLFEAYGLIDRVQIITRTFRTPLEPLDSILVIF